MKTLVRLLQATVIVFAMIVTLSDALWAQLPVNYDIVYVRAPRNGDQQRTKMPEVKDPIHMEPGSDLILLRKNGTEEVLVAGGNGGVVDPYVSLDGKWVYYSLFHDLREESLNGQRRSAPRGGSDIYKINIDSRQIVRLTNQEWTPNSGLVNWSSNHLQAQPSGSYYLGYGIFNLGPCPLPGGKVIFTSSRNGFQPNKSFTFPNLQLYVMDDDGKNVELVGHLNLGSALHPTVLKDGRVIFSSYESQGLRDERVWGIWAIWPDGRKWEPIMSPFTDAAAFHFQTQLSNGDLAFVEYYNQNNNGFGTLLAASNRPPPGVPPFGQPQAGDSSNPAIQRGIWWFDDSHPSHKKPRYKRYPFSPKGLYGLTGFTHGEDDAASRDLDGNWAGKVTHPSGAPNNDVLLVWSSGPANDLNRPTNRPVYDAGLYLIVGGNPITDHRNLVLIKNSPNFNELQPRALVKYRDIYGVDQPAELSWLPNDGRESAELPAGTPFGLVGTSSFYKRNTTPGSGNSNFNGLDPFNTSENGASSNWGTQGADAGKYSNADIWAVRVLSMEPTSHTSYGPISNGQGYNNHASERLRILGEIPLRKFDGQGNPVLDSEGNPDTSFLAKIPADTPFTFQTLDRNGLSLNTSQTWHQVRPGEVRADCGGCHAHSQVGLSFEQTAAAAPGYQVKNLALATPLISKDGSGNPTLVTSSQRAVDVEYYRDIKPILQRSCVGCHSLNNNPAAGLVLDDTQVVNGWENTYNRLARDSSATYGIKPVISNGSWRQTNASRYIRMFQSRRSLLTWKVFGARLDGWSNSDHPTESVPGDPNTLPPGANANNADIDFLGTIMPPPNSGFQPLSDDEKIMFARWIDLGSPISSQNAEAAKFGWFADDLRPTLTLTSPRSGINEQALQSISLGAFDYYSGLNRDSLWVSANFAINGIPAGTNIANQFQETADHVWTLALTKPLEQLQGGQLSVSVRDVRGNITVIERNFTLEAEPFLLPPQNLRIIRSGFIP